MTLNSETATSITSKSEFLALFPGQGSQCVGMAKHCYEAYEEARNMFNRCNDALGFSLSELCFNGPLDKLTQTQFAQPAILLCSYIAFDLTAKERQLNIVAGLGHSLGEYSALVAAGAIDIVDAVKIVHKRGLYMQEAVAQGVGRMVAILGKDLSEIEAAVSKVGGGIAEIANINAIGQVVVSGDVAGVNEFLEYLPNCKHKFLNVSAPFHCSLMKPAAERLKVDLDELEILPANFPVLSNCFVEPLTDTQRIREALYQQVFSPVRFVECLEFAKSRLGSGSCIEFGAGNVLSGLLKRSGIEFTSYQVSIPSDLPKDISKEEK
jgi:[acyl-carrier-protein] S-malonyltransferase